MRPTRTIAGVLIGGQSRRMGTCKALLPYRGTAFVDRVIAAAKPAVDEVILLGGTELSTPCSKTLLRLADAPNSGGPLAGLVPLLEYAGDRWSLLIACDMPLIQTGILARLLTAMDASIDAVAFRVSNAEGEHFPCCAVFHPRVVAAARSELARGRGLRSLFSRISCRVLEADPQEVLSLKGFNTPDEYAELGRLSNATEAVGALP